MFGQVFYLLTVFGMPKFNRPVTSRNSPGKFFSAKDIFFGWKRLTA